MEQAPLGPALRVCEPMSAPLPISPWLPSTLPCPDAFQGKVGRGECEGTRLCSLLLAWLNECWVVAFFPPTSFLSVSLSWPQYHPLIFQSQLFLNKERTGLASACAWAGGHWDGRLSHSRSVRGTDPSEAGSWAPFERSREDPAFFVALGDLEPLGMI